MPVISHPNASLHMLEDLRRLLIEGKVTTQEELCTSLESLGHEGVNQSKISRLLRKVGAVKSKNERGEIVYRLPHEPAPPVITSPLSELIIDVVANEVMVIVYTSPGAGQLIARVLDYHKKDLGIIGTIAGDDTIFVAPTSVKNIQQTSLAISQMLL
jgi:transcriptional regulator of arginine metabolism